MARILVTGGTGVLGSYLVPCLLGRGHEVRVLSRHPWRGVPPGSAGLQGDVVTGEGVEAAVAGTDAVIHAATSARRRARVIEVDGTRNVLAEARAARAHFIYVSIVGVDRHRFPYYRAKWAAEQIVEEELRHCTIQRTTQFHDLIDALLGMRVCPAPRNTAFQPVDAGEVSQRLADLVDAGPSGRVEDFGGPEVLAITQLNTIRRRVTGRNAWIVPLPRIGFLRDLDAGYQLCPAHRQGRLTWEAWLQRRWAAGGDPAGQGG